MSTPAIPALLILRASEMNTAGVKNTITTRSAAESPSLQCQKIYIGAERVVCYESCLEDQGWGGCGAHTKEDRQRGVFSCEVRVRLADFARAQAAASVSGKEAK